ncbi:nucleoside-diphosphate-sugar epimerase [Shewanella psychrophila]|uniref:Nucleoside-diphosphate-sugar epimerase n=1 Tax=Shewanella psychrophila TaxID=225848 RepID=A0A1S6HTJ9_9GAMM|nr:SDR family oxidoreductase [Shewanella psychrophila]AQS38839.1 nucleoside-diphosphate-sugar epimerase [Shewanella psychrophila]
MDVLITGGLGNLGLWITKHYLSLGHKVCVLGRSEKVVIVHPNYHFLKADITSLMQIESVIDEYFDLCIHAASYNEHFKSGYSKDALLINSLGTEYLCQALSINGVGKLIYFSTFHVYGLSEGEITERTEVEPKNDYGLTHYFAEKYIEKHSRTNGLNYLIFRLTNSYGCPADDQTDKWYLIFNDFCRQAVENNNIKLTSNGKGKRDFIWMGDVVDIISKEQYEKLPLNSIYNLSSGAIYSLRELASYVQDAYYEFSGNKIDVTFNEDDFSSANNLMVSNSKLTSFVDFEFKNKFSKEALSIFTLLGNKK